MFNVSDSAVQIALPAARMALPKKWRMQEWLTGETLSGNATMAYQLPPHSGRVWETMNDER